MKAYLLTFSALWRLLSPVERRLWTGFSIGWLVVTLLGLSVLLSMLYLVSSDPLSGGPATEKAFRLSRNLAVERGARPVAPVVKAVPVAPKEEAIVEWNPAPGLSLGGTVHVGGALKAIVVGASGQSFYLGVGGQVDGFVLVSIEKNRVVLVAAEDAGMGASAMGNHRVRKYVLTGN